MFFHGNVHCCRLVPWKRLFSQQNDENQCTRSWKANQSDLNSITTSSYHYCCAISIRRSVMQSESKDHHNSPHGVFAPWPLYLYLKETVKQVHLTDNISVFPWIYNYLSSYFQQFFPHLTQDCKFTLPENWFIWNTSCVTICLFLFLQESVL